MRLSLLALVGLAGLVGAATWLVTGRLSSSHQVQERLQARLNALEARPRAVERIVERQTRVEVQNDQPQPGNRNTSADADEAPAWRRESYAEFIPAVRELAATARSPA